MKFLEETQSSESQPSFEDSFPELKEGKFHFYPDDEYISMENFPDVKPVYNESGNYTKEYELQYKCSNSDFWLQPEDIMEHCLSKQRVKEALLKYSDYNGLYYMDLVYEELGLEDRK